ncbi:MAG: nuclear transport factor 2 family protein [Candidatus Binatia bacterium]
MDSSTEIRRISDHLAIQDVLHRYSTAIDTKDFELLDEVFTVDGVADYTASGGIRGTLPEIKAWLAGALGIFTVIQHLVTNVAVDVDGDEATTVCYLFNPLGYPREDGRTEMLYCGGLYRDRLVRTAAGWRIRERVIETLYLDGKLPGT